MHQNSEKNSGILSPGLIKGGKFEDYCLIEHIEKVTESEWKKELEFLFSGGQLDEKLLVRIANLCIEASRSSHLEVVLSILHNVNLNLPKLNHDVMINACNKNRLDCVRFLVKKGFEVKSIFEQKYDVLQSKIKGRNPSEDSKNNYATMKTQAEERKEGPLSLLRVLEASAKPVYLIAKSQANFGDNNETNFFDHIGQSFKLLSICDELSNVLKAHSNKIKAIKRELKAFQVEMLDHCDNSTQVALILAKNDEIDGVSIRDQEHIPRLYQAIRLKNKSFVVHDGCQQEIRNHFYGSKYNNNTEKGSKSQQWCYLFKQALLTQFYSLAYMICSIKDWWTLRSKRNSNDEERPNSSPIQEENDSKFRQWGNNLKNPFNRMVSDTSSYFLFIGILLLVLINPNDTPDKADLDWYDILGFIWALSYFVLEIQTMRQLASTAQTSPLAKKIECFFSDSYVNFQCLSHIIVLAGMVFKAVGENWSNLHSFSSVGISFMGLGTTMCIASILLIFRLSPKIGPIHLAIHRCFQILISFLVTYVIITLAFSVGIFYVVNKSMDNTNITSWTVFISADKSIKESWEISCIEPIANCTIECIHQHFQQSLDMENITDTNCTQSKFDLKFKTDEKFHNLQDISEKYFDKLHKAVKTHFWSIFDPGHPEFVGDVKGCPRYTAMLMWYFYNILSVIILLNLLIAIMNCSINSVHTNSIDAWKFQRTQVWMDYCVRKVILPPPLNLLGIVSCYCRFGPPTATDSSLPLETLLSQNGGQDKEYRQLLRALLHKYTVTNYRGQELDAGNIRSTKFAPSSRFSRSFSN